ncbi:hypothetical protein ACFWWM_24890 [Streptomyces sp. NPDC058682]|uniref:hypothetical protein n=1 Tax=Streptomyces sp. NPDC058682 TaxID=3346596 RepID=UPI0036611A31
MPARAMQELGRWAFPDPDVVPRDAPPIEDASPGSASPWAARRPEADRGSGRRVLLS